MGLIASPWLSQLPAQFKTYNSGITIRESEELERIKAEQRAATADKINSLGVTPSFSKLRIRNYQTPSYAARASINLQLCFIPGELLRSLMANHPQVREHLWQQALSLNSLQIDSDKNGTKKSPKLYRVIATVFKAINSVGTGQAIVLDEVLRSLIKFAVGVTARLVEIPAAVNYTVLDSRQCKDVGVVQKKF